MKCKAKTVCPDGSIGVISYSHIIPLKLIKINPVRNAPVLHAVIRLFRPPIAYGQPSEDAIAYKRRFVRNNRNGIYTINTERVLQMKALKNP